MTPAPDIDVCPSCFLFRARADESGEGRRCPPAQQMYNLRALQAARDLELLRAAVRVDAGALATFADRVRQDAAAGASSGHALALMPGADANKSFNDLRKEYEHGKERVKAPRSRG